MSFLDKIPVVSSYRKSSEADEMVSRYERRIRRVNSELEECQEDSAKIVEDLAGLKLNYIKNDIPSAIDIIKKYTNVNEKEIKNIERAYLDFDKQTVKPLIAKQVELDGIVETGVKGTAAGVALALGSMKVVSIVGTASTGTAISALSGAAAKNATLAWFGGGALKAGGAGIRGGNIMLTGVVIATGAIYGAIKYSKHAENKLTAAKEFRNEAREHEEKVELIIAAMRATNLHIELYAKTLAYISDRMNHSAIVLEEKLQGPSTDSTENSPSIELIQLILLVKAMKKLLEIDIVDDEQKPTNESIELLQKANDIKDEDIFSYSKSIATGNKSETENNIMNYFWVETSTPTDNSINRISDKKTILLIIIIAAALTAGIAYTLA